MPVFRILIDQQQDHPPVSVFQFGDKTEITAIKKIFELLKQFLRVCFPLNLPTLFSIDYNRKPRAVFNFKISFLENRVDPGCYFCFSRARKQNLSPYPDPVTGPADLVDVLSDIPHLFIVYPFAFEGKLIQYIGRIQRSEKQPVFFDYRDSRIDHSEKMFKQIMRYYKKLQKTYAS